MCTCRKGAQPYTCYTKGSFQTSGLYLTEKSSNECLPDVDVIVSACELGAGAAQGEPVHDTRQLLTYTIGKLHRPIADKVVVTPLWVLIVWKRGREGGRTEGSE